MRIYITHCSKEKLPLAKETGDKYPPDQLYTETGIQQFMEICKSTGVQWAILSDNYGVFFPDETHKYYEKPPASVTIEEENIIRSQFEQRLDLYSEIWFFVRPSTFHPFYESILMHSSLSNRIHVFSNLREVI
jgi:hypothetical protein